MKSVLPLLFSISLLAPVKSAAQKSDLCENLYSAACLDPSGKNKFSEKSAQLKAAAVKVVNDARDKAARELGFKSLDDGLRAKLHTAGLTVKESPEPYAWKKLKWELEADGDYEKAGSNVFVDPEQCFVAVETTNRELSQPTTTLTFLNKTSKETELTIQKFREKLISALALDIPGFVEEFLGRRCIALRKNPDATEATENAGLAKTCQNMSQIRYRATNLFREEGSPRYKVQSEEFIREILGALEKKPGTTRSPYQMQGLSPQDIEMIEAREKMDSSLRRIDNVCSNLADAVGRAAKNVTGDFLLAVDTAKSTVDAVIESTYREENKKIATDFLERAKSKIQEIVIRAIKDPSKKNAILGEFTKLDLAWMEKPHYSSFKKNPNGTLSLDLEQSDPEVSQIMKDPVAIFSDPALSFFTSINASYSPLLKIGKTVARNEHLELQPMLFSMMKDNPYGALAIIAHEVGHKIGPGMSKINGYDLTTEFNDLTKCFQDRQSIRMQANQKEEVIGGDYMSAEILAQHIQVLPKAQRPRALISAMEPFCIMDAQTETRNLFDCEENHPAAPLRIAGIFGANPNLREIVGCEGESTSYKSCGLKGLRLTNETQSMNRQQGVK